MNKESIVVADNLRALVSTKVVSTQFDAEIAKMQESIDLKKIEITKLKNNDVDLFDIDAKILETKSKIINLLDDICSRKKIDEAFAAIESYQAEIKELQIKYEKLEKIKLLCENYYVLRNNFIEKENEKHFKIVRFKMFETQINGGVNDTCVATVNGVPFKDLNHAMKINAGLDIINSLQEIYEVSAPIWIDNAEAVTDFETINSQCIKLYVSDIEAKNELIFKEK